MLKVQGRVRLVDQRKISPDEFQKAHRICDWVRGQLEIRKASVAEKKIDPEIALPANNWDENADQPFLNRFRKIVQGDFEVINKLRLYAQFSSYDLATQSIVTHGRSVPSITEDFDEQMERMAPAPDQWVQRYNAITERVPQEIVPHYPKVLGEIGWSLNGRVVNHDAYAYQERLNLMYEAGIIQWLRQRIANAGHVNILEIGGGYGGLARGLLDIIPKGINYFICDLPESLLSSAIYLGIACPDCQHRFYDNMDKSVLVPLDQGQTLSYIPNFVFDDFVEHVGHVDLVINTLSFPEMAEVQVRYYGTRIQKLIGDKGLLFEQNEDGRWMEMLDCKSILADCLKFRHRIKPLTIPVLAKGQADVWSNRPINAIVEASNVPFQTLGARLRLKLWKLFWLIRIPMWGVVKLRQILHANVSPDTYRLIRRLWNAVGGRMPV